MRLLVPLPFDVSDLAHGRNLRVVNLLRGLIASCEVTVLAASDAVAQAAAGVIPGVNVLTAGPDSAEADQINFIEALTGSYTLNRVVNFYGYDPALLAAVRRHARAFDAVLGFDVGSALYLLAAGTSTTGARPLLACDVIDDPWLNWRSWPASRRLCPAGIKIAVAASVIRRQLLSQLDVLTAVAPQDAASLGRATGKYVRVIPNGVHAKPVQWCQQREPLVVFTGAMSFPPNHAAARYLVRRIWPRVQARLARAAVAGRKPDAQLAIVGADPSPALQKLCAAPGVRVTGRVPDLSEWLRQARVAVAPMLSGTGVKNKVLEACAAGCPVISTRLGAAGLPTGPASGILIARDADTFARELAGLLLDPATARALGAAGQATVRREFAWSRAAEAMLAALQLPAPAAEADAPDLLAAAEGDEKEEALAYAAS